MEMRLYIDEDAQARALVNGLRARGFEILTVLEAGMKGRDDPAQLAYATQQGRVVYTFNVGHFCRLHTEYLVQGKTHTGIIVVPRQKHSIGEQLRKLASFISSSSAEEMENKLHFL